ncbi:MAG: hypothetical protein KGD68_12120 [Candidatus Lokiarchaeota archaeon]|nr:hypothetical protein [Candidatus Lokiarchaeota archaeon]
MFTPPSSIVCPFCKREINLERDRKGLLRTNDILTMRIKTPTYINAEKTTEVSVDMSVCSQCNTIIGITRKTI